MSVEDKLTATESTLDKPAGVSPPKQIDHALLARLVLREGKPFNASALLAGYSQSIAAAGMKSLIEDSKLFAEALRHEAESLKINAAKLRPLALNRLYFELIDPQSPQGMKAVELTGRLKELDMFVRSTEVNMGILVNMNETHAAPDNPVIDITKE